MDIKGLPIGILAFAKRACYWTFVLVIALFVLIFFLRTSGVGINGKATVEKALTGSAYRPYVYRVLLPTTANFLSPILPRKAALQLGVESETVLGSKFFRARLNGRLYPREVILILIMMYLSLAGFAVSMWHLVKELGYSARIRYAAPPILLLASTVFFGFGYIYDFSTLFFFSLGLLLMARQKWSWFLLVFTFGTLNKETTIFLYLIFALYYFNRMPRRNFILLSACQLGIYGLIQGTIRFAFRNNPGDALEWHFPDQLPQYRAIAEKTPILLICWGAALIIIAILVAYKWRNKPEFMRTAFSIFPFFLFLFIFWAYPLEIRDMLEVYPILAVLVLPPPALTRNVVAASES